MAVDRLMQNRETPRESPGHRSCRWLRARSSYGCLSREPPRQKVAGVNAECLDLECESTNSCANAYVSSRARVRPRCRAIADKKSIPDPAGRRSRHACSGRRRRKSRSSGLVLIVASSESTRFLLVCLASVFCASLRTIILPLNTALDWPSRMPLYSSWLAACGLA